MIKISILAFTLVGLLPGVLGAQEVAPSPETATKFKLRHALPAGETAYYYKKVVAKSESGMGTESHTLEAYLELTGAKPTTEGNVAADLLVKLAKRQGDENQYLPSQFTKLNGQKMKCEWKPTGQEVKLADVVAEGKLPDVPGTMESFFFMWNSLAELCFPDGEVAIGDTWETSANLAPQGFGKTFSVKPKSGKSKFTLVGKETVGGTECLKITATGDNEAGWLMNFSTEGMETMEITGTNTLKSEFTYWFDPVKSRVTKISGKDKMVMKMEIPGMGEMEMNNSSETTATLLTKEEFEKATTAQGGG